MWYFIEVLVVCLTFYEPAHKPSSAFTDRSCVDPFYYYLCFTFVFLILSCRFLVITCLERTDILALLCMMFLCVFVTFPYGVSGQVWYLIVSIPDLRLVSFN